MGQYCGNQTSGTSIYNPFPESLIRFTVKFRFHNAWSARAGFSQLLFETFGEMQVLLRSFSEF